MPTNKKKYAVFTIDVECFSDTGCISDMGVTPKEDMLDGLDEYIRLLERYNIKATMFTLCGAAERMKDNIAEYIRRGHKLALHGFDHTPLKFVDEQSFCERTQLAKKKLEDMFHVAIEGFRAPFFSLSTEQLNVLRKLGFKYDASYNQCSQARYAPHWELSNFDSELSGVYRNDKFYEFGLACQDILGQHIPLSGGGYTRLMNWALVKPVIKKYIKTHDYYVFYLHPFELSRKKVPKIKGLKSYDRYYLSQGVKTFPSRIVSIIEMLQEEGYEFVTFEELVSAGA
ncbi:MAG: DUF3473 domain-containing protein [Ruminococcaceae bacterium]|nr:DUF3473 domain-containing protein [Oscillospiraceae bacterium]